MPRATHVARVSSSHRYLISSPKRLVSVRSLLSGGGAEVLIGLLLEVEVEVLEEAGPGSDPGLLCTRRLQDDL